MYGCEITTELSECIHMKLMSYGIMGSTCFNCCWPESVKPVQFYCQTLPIPILHKKDSCCFREGYFAVIILFCILWLDCPAYILKCPGLLLSMTLIVYIILQKQLRMQCGHPL